ncbi:MAG: hypothetical protein ABSB23_21005 [Bryobacteraceae bacterium]|jgi:hypothetical protein
MALSSLKRKSTPGALIIDTGGSRILRLCEQFRQDFEQRVHVFVQGGVALGEVPNDGHGESGI